MSTNYARHKTALAVMGSWMALLFVTGCLNAQEPKMLFTKVDKSKVKLTEKQQKILDHCMKARTTIAVHLVEFHHEALKDGPVVIIPLDGSETIRIQGYSVAKEDGVEFLVWKGETPNYSVNVSIRGQTVRGMIYHGEELYSIEPLGNGLQMMIHLDQSKFSKDG